MFYQRLKLDDAVRKAVDELNPTLAVRVYDTWKKGGWTNHEIYKWANTITGVSSSVWDDLTRRPCESVFPYSDFDLVA